MVLVFVEFCFCFNFKAWRKISVLAGIKFNYFLKTAIPSALSTYALKACLLPTMEMKAWHFVGNKKKYIFGAISFDFVHFKTVKL